jgi:hypothetical protein
MEGKMTALIKSIDAFCARLNAGLTAVAVVLLILVAAQLTVRMPDLFQDLATAQNADVAATTNAAPVANGGF